MDAAESKEILEGLRTVTIRPMFGKKAIYHQGLIIAVELHRQALLKAMA